MNQDRTRGGLLDDGPLPRWALLLAAAALAFSTAGLTLLVI